MSRLQVRPREPRDQDWTSRLLEEHWGSTLVVTRGRIVDASLLPGFVAVLDGRPAGLVTYEINGNECELVTLNSVTERVGVGAALIRVVEQVAREADCRRLFLITTNDNTPALRFYQRRGFHLIALYPNALDESRKLKPQIPLVGLDGIPLRDELVLELVLQ